MPAFTHLTGFYFQPTLSRSYLGVTSKSRVAHGKKNYMGKEIKREESRLLNSYSLSDSVRGFTPIISSASPENIPVCGHEFSHWTDGATGAHRGEGNCPRWPGPSMLFGQSRSSRLQSPCGFQSSVPRRGQNPSPPQSLTTRRKGQKRETEMEREENISPKWAVVLKLNDQRGLERGKMRK